MKPAPDYPPIGLIGWRSR